MTNRGMDRAKRVIYKVNDSGHYVAINIPIGLKGFPDVLKMQEPRYPKKFPNNTEFIAQGTVKGKPMQRLLSGLRKLKKDRYYGDRNNRDTLLFQFKDDGKTLVIWVFLHWYILNPVIRHRVLRSIM